MDKICIHCGKEKKESRPAGWGTEGKFVCVNPNCPGKKAPDLASEARIPEGNTGW